MMAACLCDIETSFFKSHLKAGGEMERTLDGSFTQKIDNSRERLDSLCRATKHATIST